jgi:hypothetical protein
VTEDSAALGERRAETVMGTDHNSICKFDTRTEGYRTVVRLLGLVAKDAEKRKPAVISSNV